MTIILTKAAPLTKPLTAMAQHHGHKLIGISGISRRITPQSINLEAITGIVVTSQWGWKGLKTSLPDITLLADMPIICVGEATKSSIEQDGVNVSHWALDSNQLAEKLQTLAGQNKPSQWLWPCGNRPIDSWTATLTSTIHITPVEVYTTGLRKEFSTDEKMALATSPLLAITSPSNLEGLLNAGIPLPKHLVAIGHTTAAAIHHHDLTVSATAPTPNLESLIQTAIHTLSTAARG